MLKSTCGYLIRDGKWLMLLRNIKKDDVNAGKWIGVGGKTEPGETARMCMIREIKEETGLAAEDPEYRGILHFHYDDKEEEMIHIYTVEKFSGELTDCNEGTLAWIDEDKILDLPLWEGDRLFLKKLITQQKNIFCLDLYYDGAGNLLEAKEKEAEEE